MIIKFDNDYEVWMRKLCEQPVLAASKIGVMHLVYAPLESL